MEFFEYACKAFIAADVGHVRGSEGGTRFFSKRQAHFLKPFMGQTSFTAESSPTGVEFYFNSDMAIKMTLKEYNWSTPEFIYRALVCKHEKPVTVR